MAAAYFADTFWWIALSNPKDTWHSPVLLAMRSHGVLEVLCNDHHFTQEGFTILFP
jgi:predicted nucleic acid-binding protein